MADLGRLLNVNRATIQRWETGKRLPGPSKLARLSKLTGIPLTRLRPDLTWAQEG